LQCLHLSDSIGAGKQNLDQNLKMKHTEKTDRRQIDRQADKHRDRFKSNSNDLIWLNCRQLQSYSLSLSLSLTLSFTLCCSRKSTLTILIDIFARSDNLHKLKSKSCQYQIASLQTLTCRKFQVGVLVSVIEDWGA